LQESSVHALLSLQVFGVPTHWPPWHLSVVHLLPSLHVAVFGVLTQPVAGLHESLVQGLTSLQLMVLPQQTPATHRSALVQAFPSEHALVSSLV
jgi:hypothetical protein